MRGGGADREAFVTSRGFRLPSEPAELEAPVWFSLWASRRWPLEELRPGSVLFWYETPRAAIVWRSTVAEVLAAPYQSVDGAVDIIERQFDQEVDRGQPYVRDAPASGHLLAYRVRDAARLHLPRPDGMRFPMGGWERASKPGFAAWIGTALADDGRLLARQHAAGWIRDRPPVGRRSGASVACRDFQGRHPHASSWPVYREEFGRAMLTVDPTSQVARQEVILGIAMQLDRTFGGGTVPPDLLDRVRAAVPGLFGNEQVPSTSQPALGVPYRSRPTPSSTGERTARFVDPEKVDRGTAAHARVLDALAREVQRRGQLPLEAASADLAFDLAWEDGGVMQVAEVKSVTAENELTQLRLGLGQVLHYRTLLRATGRRVEAWLVVERMPTDPRWHAVCAEVGVRLHTPSVV